MLAWLSPQPLRACYLCLPSLHMGSFEHRTVKPDSLSSPLRRLSGARVTYFCVCCLTSVCVVLFAAWCGPGPHCLSASDQTPCVRHSRPGGAPNRHGVEARQHASVWHGGWQGLLLHVVEVCLSCAAQTLGYAPVIKLFKVLHVLLESQPCI